MCQVDRVVIADVAIEVLETMMFASSELMEKAFDAEVDGMLHAEIQFVGTRRGGLSILAPKSLCCEWALMMAGEDSSDLSTDALGELANVIGGNWLSRFYALEEQIKLLPPVVRSVDSNEWLRIGRLPSTVFLSVEDSPFMLSVFGLD